MPEHLLLEDDYRSFDRSIGMEAALSINAIVTDAKMPYSELQEQSRGDNLAPHIGSYLLRAEETANRHIGRRVENDSLFVGTGTKDAMPTVLEPYSKRREDALLPESQHATRTENIARLQTSISALVEPFYTGFLDKVPMTPEKPSRWRRSKAPNPVAWSEQSSLDPTLTHSYSLQPLRDGIGFSEIRCKNTSHNSYAEGVVATLNAVDTRPTNLVLAWEFHMDFGDARTMLEAFAPGLLGQCNNLGIKQWSSMNSIHIDLAEPTLRFTASTFSISFTEQKNIIYTYDADSDCFTASQPDLPPISPQTYLEVTRQVLSFMPTVQVR